MIAFTVRSGAQYAAQPYRRVFADHEESRIRLQRRLWDRFGVEANPSFAVNGTIWLRFSAQIYNNLADYEKLARAVLALRSE